MKNLLENEGIGYTDKPLENGYEGYILYSDKDNLLDIFTLEELGKSPDYKYCIKSGEIYKNRYLYYQKLPNKTKGEHVIIIMMNPAFACSLNLDNTIKNINDYLKNNSYASFEIINLYPIRTPSPKLLKTFLSNKSNNCNNYHNSLKKYIENKKDTKFVAAWGNLYHSKALGILGEIGLKYEELYVYALNAGAQPRHFSSRAYNKKDKLKDFKKIATILDASNI